MLKLEYKKIAEDTREYMIKSLESDEDYYDKAVSNIHEMMGVGNTYILNSANSCLLTLAESIPEPILVANQGGWNGFIKSCELFNKRVEYIESDYGLININLLNKYFEEHDVKTFYITSLAGYTATQPLKEIWKLCNIHNVVLILDISGSVGDEKIKDYADIQVASTGSPKIVNIENGGFINDMTGKINLNTHLLKSLKADNTTCAGISYEIKKAPEILARTVKTNMYLKSKLYENLEDNITHNVIHPHSSGLNTIITCESKSKAKKLAYNIRQEIDIEGNIITTCPNYNRVKTAAITIETKNLDYSSLTEENMDSVCEIILEHI